MALTTSPTPPGTATERKLSVAEIRSFITGKRIAGCPVCSHYNWDIREGTTAIRCVCGDATEGSAEQPAPASVGIIMLVCQNCGAVEFHDRGVIARWLDCHAIGRKS